MKVLVGRDADIKEGRLREVVADGRKYVVGRYKGQLFGMDGKCSHAGFDLAYGTVRDGAVVRPAHGAAFDVNDGKKMTHTGSKDLRVHIVSLEGDDAYIELRSLARQSLVTVGLLPLGPFLLDLPGSRQVP